MNIAGHLDAERLDDCERSSWGEQYLEVRAFPHTSPPTPTKELYGALLSGVRWQYTVEEEVQSGPAHILG